MKRIDYLDGLKGFSAVVVGGGAFLRRFFI